MKKAQRAAITLALLVIMAVSTLAGDMHMPGDELPTEPTTTSASSTDSTLIDYLGIIISIATSQI